MAWCKTFDDSILQVFVSYSHKDRAFVDRLVQDLKSRGVNVWIDQYEILGGESIRKAIEDAIENTDVFVIVLSPNSVSSAWVQEELDVIITRSFEDKAIPVPVLIEPCDVPTFLRGRKWVDFTEDGDQGLGELMFSLRTWSERKTTCFLQCCMRLSQVVRNRRARNRQAMLPSAESPSLWRGTGKR